MIPTATATATATATPSCDASLSYQNCLNSGENVPGVCLKYSNVINMLCIFSLKYSLRIPPPRPPDSIKKKTLTDTSLLPFEATKNVRDLDTVVISLFIELGLQTIYSFNLGS